VTNDRCSFVVFAVPAQIGQSCQDLLGKAPERKIIEKVSLIPDPVDFLPGIVVAIEEEHGDCHYFHSKTYRQERPVQQRIQNRLFFVTAKKTPPFKQMPTYDAQGKRSKTWRMLLDHDPAVSREPQLSYWRHFHEAVPEP
jgi:hypothetical protein